MITTTDRELQLAALAAVEKRARRRARQSMLDFSSYLYRGYAPDPFHVRVCQALDDLLHRRSKRIMIFAPPQHGKSLHVSQLFPAYHLGRRPDDPIIIASYAADLAERKSRDARQFVEAQPFRALFGDLGVKDSTPVETAHDSRAVYQWSLAAPHHGAVRAAGVGGGLTGFPAALAVMDDLIKDWQSAQSATTRNSAWDWYTSVLRTRVWEQGAIVYITTRWHEDDPAGRLLQQGGWEVLRFPALAETQEERDENNRLLGLPPGLPDPLGRAPGEPLAPSRFSREALLAIKQDIGSLKWSALYQGVPRAGEGERIKREWLTQGVDAVPEGARYVRYWDKAGTAGGDGAATAGVLLARHQGLTYVVHVERGRYSALQREQIIRQTTEMDAARYRTYRVYIEQEPGSGGKESAEATIRMLAGYSVYADRPHGDKDTRMEPFIAQAEAQNVRLVRGSWHMDYIDEMTAIPNGKTRDQADATAGAFNRLTDWEANRSEARIGKATFSADNMLRRTPGW